MQSRAAIYPLLPNARLRAAIKEAMDERARGETKQYTDVNELIRDLHAACDED